MSQLKFVSKEPIRKGQSCDKKYCVATAGGDKFLLRITPEEKSQTRADMFCMQQKVAALGVPMCKPVEFGKCSEGVYILQTWVYGQDAGQVIADLADTEQYAYGIEAGQILKTIHSIPAPETLPDWEIRFNAKINHVIQRYRQCPIQVKEAENFIACIEANRHLLANRPQYFQHGDYQIGNMMIEDGRLVIIDFDRYDFGDPWEEFNRIIWCAQASPLFASGMVNGYFDNEIPDAFWKLLALYISSDMLSSILWEVSSGEDTLLKQAKEVLNWYDDMQNLIPSWYSKGFYLQYIDGLVYKLKSPFDFSFVSRYGRVFQIFDDQDSGNICFGTEKDGQKFLIKYAGAPTEAYDGTAEDAVKRLKFILPIYRDLRHPSLVELVAAEEICGGFAALFTWADGDCMGRNYPAAHRRFMNLSIEARMKVFGDIVDFLKFVNDSGYVAIDFYDGSILYDFESGKTTICDIDLFRKKPYVNNRGRMWGSSRFMSPEEFERGAEIDEVTNVYTVGAFAFALFSGYNRTYEKWPLSRDLFMVASKATDHDRSARQPSLQQFWNEWEAAISGTSSNNGSED